MKNKDKYILSLFDYSGHWAKPYKDNGYHTILIDLKHDGQDVRLYKLPSHPIYGILAAPPCDNLAVSGARWWKQKGDRALLDSLSMVDAVYRIVLSCKLRGDPLKFWCLENPVGRLVHYTGKPRLVFNPCDYAGYLDDPDHDAYTKRTCLWGEFNVPKKKERPPIKVCKQGSWVQKLGGKSEKTKTIRSTTPMGFAKAFYEANK